MVQLHVQKRKAFAHRGGPCREPGTGRRSGSAVHSAQNARYRRHQRPAYTSALQYQPRRTLGTGTKLTVYALCVSHIDHHALLWVVDRWSRPMSYMIHIALYLCHGGPRPPTKCCSGPLVRISTTHAQGRDTSLPPLPCMHARKSNHGGQPRRTLGPTHTSSTRVRALSAAG